MIVFPAIDLIDGKVVRLWRGERSSVHVYDDDPAHRARLFREAGAQWIHVVDLSRALGDSEAACDANLRAIEALCGVSGLQVDAGGGVRTMDDLERLFSLGCARVALGTPLVKDLTFAAQAAERYGKAVVADVAAAKNDVRVNGWQENAPVALDALLDQLRHWGFGHLVFTDIDRDGTGAGIDAERYRQVAALAGFPVVASGGVASAHDLKALAALGYSVLEGVIIGRALYEKTVDLREALAIFAAATPSPHER